MWALYSCVSGSASPYPSYLHLNSSLNRKWLPASKHEKPGVLVARHRLVCIFSWLFRSGTGWHSLVCAERIINIHLVASSISYFLASCTWALTKPLISLPSVAGRSQARAAYGGVRGLPWFIATKTNLMRKVACYQTRTFRLF